MVDIDHFKRINDVYGHLVGDAVLHAFASCCDGRRRRLSDVRCRDVFSMSATAVSAGGIAVHGSGH